MDEETLKRISSSIKEQLATLSQKALPSDLTYHSHLTDDLTYFRLSDLTDFLKQDAYRHRDWHFISKFPPSFVYAYGKRYLELIPKRGVDEASAVDRFVLAMMGHTNFLEGARQFYEINDRSRIDFVAFVKKSFIESCFVIELFRKYAMKELRDPDDPIFNTPQNLHEVRLDLISQYRRFPPFFVLVEFFNVTKIQDDPRDNLIDLALLFFQNLGGHPLKPSPPNNLIDLALLFFKNLVGHPLRPSPPNNNPIQIDEIKHLVDLVHKALSVPVAAETSITVETDIELQYINYATELEEAGVKFKRMKGNNLEIKFQNGVLEIPPIKVARKTTLVLLEWLMEYETYTLPASAPRNVNDYLKFIQCLINSPKDVELLRRSGIIENWLGNDQLIYDKLIELGNKSKISRNFTYSGIFKKVNEHCGRRRNVWMAKLWRNYFNSPWSFISFLAAVVLLLLTLTQTVFSILSYHPS